MPASGHHLVQESEDTGRQGGRFYALTPSKTLRQARSARHRHGSPETPPLVTGYGHRNRFRRDSRHSQEPPSLPSREAAQQSPRTGPLLVPKIPRARVGRARVEGVRSNLGRGGWNARMRSGKPGWDPSQHTARQPHPRSHLHLRRSTVGAIT